jgi:hypothetical protein
LKAFEKQLCLLVKVEYLLKFTSIFFRRKGSGS